MGNRCSHRQGDRQIKEEKTHGQFNQLCLLSQAAQIADWNRIWPGSKLSRKKKIKICLLYCSNCFLKPLFYTQTSRPLPRAFPGLFKRKTPSVKTQKRGAKSKHIHFFLLDKVTDRTPKTSEEMVLLQAGLGQRTIDIPEEADHSRLNGNITDILL